MDQEGMEQFLWIVSAPFCTIGFLEDSQFKPDDLEANSERHVQRLWKDNIEFYSNLKSGCNTIIFLAPYSCTRFGAE